MGIRIERKTTAEIIDRESTDKIYVTTRAVVRPLRLPGNMPDRGLHVIEILDILVSQDNFSKIVIIMDPIRNPFAPGAGTPPPALAGRDALRQQISTAIARTKLGRPTKSALMVGLRGVGKTVLLDQMQRDAEPRGIQAIRIEAPENRSLPAMLAPQLRLALIDLRRLDAAKELATRALRALSGFAKALKVKYADIEIGLDFDSEPGLADNGDLEGDLAALLSNAGKAAKAVDTALILFIDELQYVPEEQLAALVTALHRCNQDQIPVMLVGAGLPQLRARAGIAKSYAERLFDFPTVGPLPEDAATEAIVIPARNEGVEIEADALKEILEAAQGYPYFLQEWGKHAWNAARQSPITHEDVRRATDAVIAHLDESFFRVRFERLTPAERTYLRAMAALGPGPHRSGDIAENLGKVVTSQAPVRSGLIAKGMIWSPSHGDTAFTVPLFDAFMTRVMPGDGWRNG